MVGHVLNQIVQLVGVERSHELVGHRHVHYCCWWRHVSNRVSSATEGVDKPSASPHIC